MPAYMVKKLETNLELFEELEALREKRCKLEQIGRQILLSDNHEEALEQTLWNALGAQERRLESEIFRTIEILEELKEDAGK